MKSMSELIIRWARIHIDVPFRYVFVSKSKPHIASLNEHTTAAAAAGEPFNCMNTTKHLSRTEITQLR